MRADLQVMAAVVLTASVGRLALNVGRGGRVRSRLVAPTTGRVRHSTGNRAAILVVVGGCVGGLTIGGIGFVIGAASALGVVRGVRIAEGARQAARIEQDLPLALETMARVLRSGTSPFLAVAETASGMSGPVADDLRELALDATRFGLLPAALAWGRRQPRAALAARSLAVALQAGTGAAEGLDAIAITLRERNAVQRETRALAAQARLSAAVMACTPVGFAVLLCGTDPDARAFLLHSRPGSACLLLGLAMDLVGYRWMRAITRVP